MLKLCEQPDIYARFMSGLCRKADEKYNSGLFHFQKEPGVSEAPDRSRRGWPWTTRFSSRSCKASTSSTAPYHFGVMPVEILGTVYERFLGKVIRLTAGHQAKVEEKPEVRKAGGVYYTPAYIVELHRQATPSASRLRAKAPPNSPAAKRSRPSASWTWPAAAARSCWAPISACSTIA